jgi:putative endonuclease
MKYFTYILYSETTGSFYKGSTENVARRLIEHNEGRTRSNKHGIPWILLWANEKSNRAEAMTLETKLKNLTYDCTLEFMMKYHTSIVDQTAKEVIARLVLTRRSRSGC